MLGSGGEGRGFLRIKKWEPLRVWLKAVRDRQRKKSRTAEDTRLFGACSKRKQSIFISFSSIKIIFELIINAPVKKEKPPEDLERAIDYFLGNQSCKLLYTLRTLVTLSHFLLFRVLLFKRHCWPVTYAKVPVVFWECIIVSYRQSIKIYQASKAARREGISQRTSNLITSLL